MKNPKILVDREPLSKDYIQSKENFGHVLSQVKNLKPPVWKTPWFYGPVGLAVIAVTVSTVQFNTNEHLEKQTKLVKELPENVRKLEVQQLAIISPKEFEKKSVREAIPSKKKEAQKSEVKIKEDIKVITDVEVFEVSNTQLVDLPKVENSSKKSFPNIGGVYTGEIALNTLCSAEGISCGDLTIKSYTLQYFNGSKEVTRSVVGNTIPDDVCEVITEHNWGSMIFLTKIMGTNQGGDVFRLPSMSFVPH